MVNIQNWVLDYKGEFSLPNFTITQDVGVSNYLTAGDGNQRNNGYSVASTGMSYLSRSLATIWLLGQRSEFTYAKVGRPIITLQSEDENQPLLKPLVQVQCVRPLDISSATKINVTFNTSSLIFKEGENSGNISRTIDVTGYQSEEKSVQFSWTDSSMDFRSLTLGALFGASFTTPERVFSSFRGYDARALFACAVKPYWVPTTMSRDPTTDNVITLDNPKPYDILTNKDLMGKARDLNVDMSFAEHLNAYLNRGSSFQNVLEFELSRFAFDSLYFDGNWVDSWQCSYPTSDNYPDQVRADTTKHPVKWKMERFGYAWGFNKSTKVLASVVLLAHILLITVHLGIVWRNKLRFDSWERLVDFMTLAMQSPPPSQLNGTSAAVRNAQVFADPVYIRESDDDDGVILVMDDHGKEGLRKRLAVGKKYT